ncbi:hypothetical protein MN116_004575 [Schistosoma mekongi]|uniref:Large ribosomal subunit protein mL50 n=1 Tax=Schistosoma mekongi TaxID=38744 RepID=A0AAE2D505_SCHME|nr:hypothetical protein MN116_004575 [Schistosoma mekongi]
MLRYAATNVKSLRLSIFSNYLSSHQSDEPKVHSFTSRLQSLADKSKNILMNRDPYCPPHDVESRIEVLSQKLFNLNTSNNSQWKAYRFQNNDEKYKMFTACISEFQHHIANSYLHEINCIDDLIKYFLTPVETPDFLYKLTKDSQNNLCKLPSNLNIQLEPLRYNPNEDNFFKANAYPGRSTIVSNLAAAKKYPSYRVSRRQRVRVEYEDM